MLIFMVIVVAWIAYIAGRAKQHGIDNEEAIKAHEKAKVIAAEADAATRELLLDELYDNKS